jgi:hypothetical protein
MIHSLNKYFLNIYYVPGTIWGTECTAMSETDKIATLMELT